MKLNEIATLIEARGECPPSEIEAVVCDSRKAADGSLFFCLRGAEADGHQFAAAAVQKGACAIVCEERVPELAAEIPQLLVADSRRALAFAAEALAEHPSRKLQMLGMTGTNGKTTTTHLIRSVLERYGRKTGLIGTNHILIGEETIPAVNTTPESVEITGYLARMVDAGCESAVMEVSSHGLKQGRVAALDFDVAAFSNLTRDHLDYHGDFDDYLKSKLLLFTTLKEDGRCVVNADDPYGKFFVAAAPGEVKTYGIHSEADFRAENVRLSAAGTAFDLWAEGKAWPVRMPLLGEFNVYNALCAIAVLSAAGVPLDFSVGALAAAPQVRGRFERVEAAAGPTVIIDYAHSPDGLENILKTAQAIKQQGRLFLVFGCGGDRDRSKRPVMGELGARYADYAVVTSDNPRTEDPLAIIAMVEEGVKRLHKPYAVIADRREAIGHAIGRAAAEDVVIIAGKGHEDYQIIGKTKIHFDDFEEAEKALAACH